jgi:hypothetical protein
VRYSDAGAWETAGAGPIPQTQYDQPVRAGRTRNPPMDRPKSATGCRLGGMNTIAEITGHVTLRGHKIEVGSGLGRPDAGLALVEKLTFP